MTLMYDAKPPGFWTMDACNEWANKTFGKPRSLFSTAARANEEMAELVREFSILPADHAEWNSDQRAKVLKECADVAIVTFRVADMMGLHVKARAFDVSEHIQTMRNPPSDLTVNLSVVEAVGVSIVAANRNMGNILGSTYERQKSMPRSVVLNCEAQIFWLYRHMATICKLLDSDLQDEIDRKQFINERRVFTSDADNNGYHIPQNDTTERLAKLDALETFGVDNWEYFDEAMASLDNPQ
jgi:NTP pyrophosphatase (non-canonical NTP hydrolase)